ncbi:MAG: hypothetical protein KKI08_11590, partial [Armatimonadetes bacterium]|nr:hypothetical protein [Armatimonadota bacterium]
MWAGKKMATIGRGAGLLLALLPVVACAQTTFEYNTQPRTFRVCRLLLPQETTTAAGNYENPAGSGRYWYQQPSDIYSLVFEGMRRLPGKPAGWELINPLAQNPALLKTDAGYWEAPHSLMDLSQGLPAPVLRDLDLIYIRAPQLNLPVDVWPQWRSALLRAVQDGAVLWIDQPVVSGATAVTAFCPPGWMLSTGVSFGFALAGQTNGSYRRSYAGVWDAQSGNLTLNLSDRLLDFPFPLQEWRDIQYLGMYPQGPNVNTAGLSPIPDTLAESASPDVVTLGDPNLRPIVVVRDGAAWQNNIAAGRLGAGAIVLTAGDVGYDVVNWWRGAHLNRPVLHQAADCKFAWNVLAAAQSFSERGGSSSSSAASPASIPPPLGIQWQFPDRTARAAAWEIAGSIVGAPAVGRHMTYVLALGRNPSVGFGGRAPQLLAFDSDPARDLDDDGRADDGIQDYSLGRSYDMVWGGLLDVPWNGANSDWTTRWSSPTVATMQLATGQNIEVVLVSLTLINPSNGDDGRVQCYRADNGTLLWTRTIASYNSNCEVVDLSTPTVYGDWVFVLASEHGDNADNGAGAEDAFGTAHCFQLSYDWSANQNGPQWNFPSNDNNPNDDGDQTGGSPDSAIVEQERYL